MDATTYGHWNDKPHAPDREAIHGITKEIKNGAKERGGARLRGRSGPVSGHTVDETLRRTPHAGNMHHPTVIEPDAVREEEEYKIIGADETYVPMVSPLDQLSEIDMGVPEENRPTSAAIDGTEVDEQQMKGAESDDSEATAADKPNEG